MKQRPVSVTIVSGIAIAFGTLTLYSLIAHGTSPLVRAVLTQAGISPTLLNAIRVVSVPVDIGAGIGLLLGRHWARVTLVAWRGAVLAIGAVAFFSVASLVTNLALVGILAFLLFSPAANAFFAPAERSGPAA
jgi:hypothetical protein